MPQFCRGRAMHLIAENHAYQLLHLRLCLLREPPQQRPPARHVFRLGTGRTDYGILPSQLYRRPVPQFRRCPQSGLYHGTARACRQRLAPGAPLQRVYPPEKHSRCQSRTGKRSRTLRRPSQRQRRNPQRRKPETACTGEGS